MSRKWKIVYGWTSCLLGGVLGSGVAWFLGFRAVDGGTGLLMTALLAAAGAGSGIAGADRTLQAMSDARATIEARLQLVVEALVIWMQRAEVNVEMSGGKIRPGTKADLDAVVERGRSLLRVWENRGSKSTRHLRVLCDEIAAVIDSIQEVMTRVAVENAINQGEEP